MNIQQGTAAYALCPVCGWDTLMLGAYYIWCATCGDLWPRDELTTSDALLEPSDD